MVSLHKNEVLITAEEFARLPDLGSCELVNGRIVHVSPAQPFHGIVEFRLGARLVDYADATGRGLVMGGEAGLWVKRNPDTVRGADIVFISRERYALRNPKGFLDVPPELVIEVLSPEDRRGEMMEKVEEYLAMGVEAVWIVDPEYRYVLAYRSLMEVERFEEGDVLTDEVILPGFSVLVADLFRE